MVLNASVGIWPGFGGFLAGAACVWLRGGRIRAELNRTRWAAEHDGLTSLPNRAGLRTRYEAHRSAGLRCSLVLLDLNGFKQINDSFGHPAGDRLLVEVARRLADACRPYGFPGRLGGDEFLVLLPQTPPAEIVAVVESLLQRIAAPVTINDDAHPAIVLTVTASAGIAKAAPEDIWNAQLRRADIALYQAKAGPVGITSFEQGMQHPSCTGSGHRRSRSAARQASRTAA